MKKFENRKGELRRGKDKEEGKTDGRKNS